MNNCWGIKKYLETNENGNITHQNLWDTAEEVLRGKFIDINIYIKKLKKISNNLILYLKRIEKAQIKPKISRWKEITKIKAKINETDLKKKQKRQMKLKTWFFEKINIIDKAL